MPRLLGLTLAAACSLAVAGCGSSGTPSRSSSTTGGLANQGLAFARCMRSHGVTNFPDPSNRRISFTGSTDSPAFASAQTACAHLAPQKVLPSSGRESPQQLARDHAKLLSWASCMRHHGYPSLPDAKIGTPRPEAGVGTVLGQGGAYLPIPTSIDAHSQKFLQTARSCGINPTGR